MRLLAGRDSAVERMRYGKPRSCGGVGRELLAGFFEANGVRRLDRTISRVMADDPFGR